jgi:DNA helicase IV
LSNEEIDREQEYISMLYGRLDGLRERVSARLSGVLLEGGGTHQARTERDSSAAMYSQRIAQLDAAENGLCFGRLDFAAGDRRYIGRIGIHDDSDDFEPLLMDWRAPAARPFYTATAVRPEDVRQRRHIRTSRRKVTGLDDEVLDLTAADPARHEGLTGEAALLAALNASRTGRMNDIVETIQAEQDRIIRSGRAGVMVVQGGPGTGKTAVALHRAAFLLYTHRQQLSSRGVLIVGPNATFLRYIGNVLPSLGETAVVLSTIGGLFPGVTARRAEPPEAAAIKGRLVMKDVIAAAVRDREQVPHDVLEIASQQGTLRLDRRTCAQAIQRARRSRRPHNLARPVFARAVIDALAQQIAGGLAADMRETDQLVAEILGEQTQPDGNMLADAELDDIRRELRQDAAVRAAIGKLWPALTPQRLLADLLGSAERLAAAAPGLTEDERGLLRRDPDADQDAGWTAADVPLLDEAAELLGEDDRAARAAEARRRQQQIAYAQGVLDITARDVEDDPEDFETLTAADVVDASRLAERFDAGDTRTIAERAADDRTWTFGHVIVDEAQELSEMAWRILMRRCPSRSMTVAGDLAQESDLAGTPSWEQVLAPYADGRWRLEQLTINYRTPAEVMDLAGGVLAQIDPALKPPRSVRESGVRPWRLQVAAGDLAGRVAAIAAKEAAEVGDGRLAVIVPAARLDEVAAAVAEAVPTAAAGENPDLENPVVVLSTRQAKGLEFDSVLVVDPGRILAESARGLNDLYVALTRTTRRLGVVHPGEPPAVLSGLGLPA